MANSEKIEKTRAAGKLTKKDDVVYRSKTTAREARTGQFLVRPANVDGLRKRGFSSEEIYDIVAPRRTLARRKERGEKLSVAESDRVHRLERISELADRVFGDADKARKWMRKSVIALDGAVPIDLLQSETGAHLVEQELIRIDFGILA